MAMDDLYEVSLKGAMSGQECWNVLHYWQELEFVTTYSTKAQVLAENWYDQIFPSIQGIASEDVSYSEIRVRNLFTQSDRYNLAISEVGTGATEGAQTLPTFAAFGYTLLPETPVVKPGAKRFVGVPEICQADGVINVGGYITTLQALETKLEAAVTVGAVIQDPCFVPIIVKRIRSGSPGAYEYRLPETSLEAVFSKIAVAAFNAIITSQISRKVGVGL